MSVNLLVSAIMPTRGRQQWAAEAVQMFREQTYPLKELVIIDDIMEPSFPLGNPGHGTIYERVPRATIGAKRNMAISRARGPVICHWDSDDLYSPDRIAVQVEQLLAAEADMVGYHSIEFFEHDGARRRFRYEGRPGYCVGTSMMYWTDIWSKRPFGDIQSGEDSDFQRGRRTATMADTDGRILARIHAGNTSDKRENIDGPHPDLDRWRLIA